MKAILSKPIPFNLQELKFEFCQIDKYTISEFCESLEELSINKLSNPSIEVFSLIDAKFNGK